MLLGSTSASERERFRVVLRNMLVRSDIMMCDVQNGFRRLALRCHAGLMRAMLETKHASGVGVQGEYKGGGRGGLLGGFR